MRCTDTEPLPLSDLSTTAPRILGALIGSAIVPCQKWRADLPPTCIRRQILTGVGREQDRTTSYPVARKPLRNRVWHASGNRIEPPDSAYESEGRRFESCRARYEIPANTAILCRRSKMRSGAYRPFDHLSFSERLCEVCVRRYGRAALRRTKAGSSDHLLVSCAPSPERCAEASTREREPSRDRRPRPGVESWSPSNRLGRFPLRDLVLSLTGYVISVTTIVGVARANTSPLRCRCLATSIRGDSRAVMSSSTSGARPG
jgi:hypothetical protein